MMLKGKKTAGTLVTESIPGGGHMVVGSDNVDRFRVLTLRGALRLEVVGLSRRGRSVYSIVKEEFGFKGNKQSVLDQLNEWIENNILPQE